MKTHLQTNLDQYNSRSQAYFDSSVHSAGPDLIRAKACVIESIPHHGSALDVGCGAGHLSFTLAPHLARVVALDPSADMLSTVRQVADSRGLRQIETVNGTAEMLPFQNDCFDLVCTRYSAHHWTNLELALDEMRRVLKPNGQLLVIDILGEDDALVDGHLQTMEFLRDRSHVRNRTGAQWRSLLSDAKFSDIESETFQTHLDFSTWIARMRTPPAKVSMIRDMQREAPKEVRDALAFHEDGSFTVRTGLFFAMNSTMCNQ